MGISKERLGENQLLMTKGRFYNAMRKKKCSHHDTIHLIGAIFVPLMFDTLKNKAPFDNDRYVSMLKKYKSRKPDRIWALLDASDTV